MRCRLRPAGWCSGWTGIDQAAGVGVMNQPPVGVGCVRSAGPDCLFESVEGQVGTQRSRDTPSDNEPRVRVDHQRCVREARPGRNIGYVGEPKPVRTVGLEATINQIGGSGRAVIWDGRALLFASDHAF